jgi:hypothetical protein
MRIFNQKKNQELQLSELNLDIGQLVSNKLNTIDANGKIYSEDILIYNPMIAKAQNNIKNFKAKLSDSDYKTIKFMEGELTAEEYEATKQQRKEWRIQINNLEDYIEKWKEI